MTIKADLKQCECMITSVSPWSLGGRGETVSRCTKKTLWIVKNGKESMGLCGGCKKKFVNANGDDFKIEKVRS